MTGTASLVLIILTPQILGWKTFGEPSTGGGDCRSLRPSSINWVYRTRITTIFILYNIDYIDFLYTTYIFRII